MGESNNSRLGLYWIADASDSVESRKYSQRADDILNNKSRRYDSMNRSRIAGAAIQFFEPSGYLRRREEDLERLLTDEGVDKEVLPFSPSDANFMKNKIRSVDLVDYREWDEDCDVRTEVSLPKSLIDAVEDACEKWDGYDLRQKSRWISNAVIAFDASQFKSLMERIETKEQLLATSRGEQVTQPTDAYELIMSENEYREDLRDQIEEARPVENEQVAKRMKQIDPDENVVIEEGEEPEWSALPIDYRYRDGAMLGVIRRIARETGDGFTQKNLNGIVDYRFSEYDSIDYFVKEHILPYLEEGADEQYYVSPVNAPEPVTSVDVAADVKKLSSMRAVNRKVKTYAKRHYGEDVWDIFTEQYDGTGVYAADPSDFTAVFSREELEDMRDYLLQSLNADKQEYFIENDAESLHSQ